MKKFIVLVCLTLLAGCGTISTESGAALLGAATTPGADTRCVTGMGFEFCYFRERTVVQPAKSEND